MYADNGDSLADAGAELVVFVLLGAGLIFVGVVVPTTRARLAGLATGAAAAVGGLMAFSAALFYEVARSFRGFSELQLGPGYYLVALAAAGCLAVVAMTWRRRPSRVAERGIITGLGVAGSVAIVLGTMIPPTSLDVSFVDANFRWGSSLLQVAHLYVLAGFGAAGLLGFIAGTRWGVVVVVGGLVPLLWMMLISSEDPSALAVRGALDEVHPLVWLGVVAQGAAALAVWSRLPPDRVDDGLSVDPAPSISPIDLAEFWAPWAPPTTRAIPLAPPTVPPPQPWPVKPVDPPR